MPKLTFAPLEQNNGHGHTLDDCTYETLVARLRALRDEIDEDGSDLCLVAKIKERAHLAREKRQEWTVAPGDVIDLLGQIRDRVNAIIVDLVTQNPKTPHA